MNPINAANLSPAAMHHAPATSAANNPQQAFKDLMLDSIDHVNSMQHDANRAVEQLTASDVNPTEVLSSVQKADMTFQMMMQIRNQLVQAYQEIKDIPI